MRVWARYLNVLLGIWLFISAFLWSHTPQQRTNTWIVGLLVVAFSLWALSYATARYLNTAAAIWLFFSTWALPTLHAGTVWNNLLVAIAVFIFSLIPAGTRAAVRPQPVSGAETPRAETRRRENTQPPPR